MVLRSKGIIKAVVLVCVAVLLVGALAGCGGAKKEPAKEEPKGDGSLARVKAAGKITFGTDDTYPPFEFRNDKNELVGFDIDLATEIAKRLGVTAEFKPTAWDGIIPSLVGKQYDAIISGMNITEDRLKEVNFSDAYLAAGQVIVVKKDNTTVSGVKDLEGKRIAVQIGTTNEEAARKIKDANVVTFNSFVDAFTDVANGRSLAVIVDEPVGRYYTTLQPDVYKVVGDAFDRAPVGIAIRKEDVELVNAVNKALADMKADGAFAAIAKKWFGDIKF